MPPEEFREWGRRAVDWIARYLEEVDAHPVLSRARAGDLRRRLPPRAPEEPEPPSVLMEDFEEAILPGITHWNHPSFLGYFAITGSGPGILGEILAAGLNVNAMVWRSSPAATELEEHTADWVRDLLGLPAAFAGHIQDTASSSTLLALAGARHRAYPEVREEGLFGCPPGRVYASREAHSSVEKAVMALGMGRRGVRKVGVDGAFRLRPEALREAVREDLEAGVRPVAVVATLGTTATSSMDPVEAVAEVARELGLWLHVDAAYAGAAAMVPELREPFRGWEEADSVVFNPHKWLFTPVDCSLLFGRSPSELKAALSLTPEYLRSREEGEATNLMDYGIPLGRRFRALKLWFVLRYFGARGIRDRIRAHVALAERFAGWVREAPGWELVAPVPFSTVAFRHAPPGLPGEALDRLNLEILERVNASGEAFLTHARPGERIALRLSVGNLRTREGHLARSWELLRDAAEALGTGGP